MALLEDHERIDQLVAEEPVTETDESEACKGGDDVLAADAGSIAGFQPPERDQDVAIDPEAPLDLGELAGIARGERAALLDLARGDQGCEVVADAALKLGLFASVIEHAGIEAQAGDCEIEGLA